jgi:hypothetical protein
MGARIWATLCFVFLSSTSILYYIQFKTQTEQTYTRHYINKGLVNILKKQNIKTSA